MFAFFFVLLHRMDYCRLFDMQQNLKLNEVTCKVNVKLHGEIYFENNIVDLSQMNKE